MISGAADEALRVLNRWQYTAPGRTAGPGAAGVCIPERFLTRIGRRFAFTAALSKLFGMSHYDFAAQFRLIYDHAVARYAAGQRGPETLFDTTQREFLAGNGITPQHLYDYAEDHNNYSGEPGYDRALTIESVRRDYFLAIQKSRASVSILDDSTLPSKSEAVRGIEWLPRLIPKARAKLGLPRKRGHQLGGFDVV